VSAGHSIAVEDYSAGPHGAPIRYVALDDWGHRWPSPGGALSARSDNFNAADLITEFFSGLSWYGKDATMFSAVTGERRAHA
jgi:poly(3-hydroxybutyrate) depolymerase